MQMNADFRECRRNPAFFFVDREEQCVSFSCPLGYEEIGTHSFRKWYATEIYNSNGYDIALVQRLLQHSSAATTQRYIGIEPQRIEEAILNHSQLI